MKGNKEICSFKKNERALCDSHTKSSGTVPHENWKMMRPNGFL